MVLFLCLPLLFIVIVYFWQKTMDWQELLLHLGIQLVFLLIAAGWLYYSDRIDTETLNGYVVSKQQVKVSCDHSYECNCRTVSSCSGYGKTKSCTNRTVCKTCYEHSNDWNWEVSTSIKQTINIDRVDSRGSKTPPRWTSVNFGDPVATKHQYISYTKAAKDSLFRRQNNAAIVPNYPGEIYDYYRIDRFVSQGVTVADPLAWNSALSQANARIGSEKQVNLIVVLTDQPQTWYYDLEAAWAGGKKNDVVLVIGTDPQASKTTWVSVMTWTTEELFKVKLRDAILALPVVTPEAAVNALEENVRRYYKRKPMADFEYLNAAIQPSIAATGVVVTLGILLAIGLFWVMNKYEPFGVKQRNHNENNCLHSSCHPNRPTHRGSVEYRRGS